MHKMRFSSKSLLLLTYFVHKKCPLKRKQYQLTPYTNPTQRSLINNQISFTWTITLAFTIHRVQTETINLWLFAITIIRITPTIITVPSMITVKADSPTTTCQIPVARSRWLRFTRESSTNFVSFLTHQKLFFFFSSFLFDYSLSLTSYSHLTSRLK